MNSDANFYTFRGYSLKDARRRGRLSPSMEDYLEMIMRLSEKDGSVRVLELAEALHVKPPSASRMLQRLDEENLVKYEKYGLIRLTPKGKELGGKLLARHAMLEAFFRLLGLEDVLEDTERIEHSLSIEAIESLKELLSFFSDNPQAKSAWEEYRVQTKKRQANACRAE